MSVEVEILKIAKQYLKKVRRSGPENVMAICPFHRKSDGSEEITQSFALSLTKGVYFCHACHAAGGIITLLRHVGINGIAANYRYSALLDEIKKRTPAPPDPLRPKGIHATEESALDEAVLGFFDYDVTQAIPPYKAETLKHFEIGWDGWFNRVTFPIRDLQGKLVAISGRATLEGQWPRYKIYDDEYLCWHLPARKNWNKRTALWNIHRVYPSLIHQNINLGYVVVVEGFKAAMSVWEAGIINVVALLGSYLSWEHQWILEHLGVPVYLFLDKDKAGILGQQDACTRLSKAIPYLHIIEYPERLNDVPAQPDFLTPEEIRQQVAKAPSYVTRYVQRKLGDN